MKKTYLATIFIFSIFVVLIVITKNKVIQFKKEYEQSVESTIRINNTIEKLNNDLSPSFLFNQTDFLVNNINNLITYINNISIDDINQKKLTNELESFKYEISLRTVDLKFDNFNKNLDSEIESQIETELNFFSNKIEKLNNIINSLRKENLQKAIELDECNQLLNELIVQKEKFNKLLKQYKKLNKLLKNSFNNSFGSMAFFDFTSSNILPHDTIDLLDEVIIFNEEEITAYNFKKIENIKNANVTFTVWGIHNICNQPDRRLLSISLFGENGDLITTYAFNGIEQVFLYPWKKLKNKIIKVSFAYSEVAQPINYLVNFKEQKK
ncbi:MAG: hypothetical protein ACERKD_03035 [Prolixibacteraceae bacterium]